MASDGTYFDTDCKVMLHFEGVDESIVFADSSDSAHSFSRAGTPIISTDSKKFGSASGLFPGGIGTNYIYAPNSTDFDLGSEDWTIDLWGNFSADRGNAPNMVGTFDGTNGWLVTVYPALSGGQINVYNDNGILSFYFQNISFPEETQTHIAIVVASGKGYLFVNGVLVAGNISVTGTFNSKGHSLLVGGASWVGISLNGYIDEFRLVKGTAVWTTDFTPPAAAYVPKMNRTSSAFFQLF